MRKGQVSDCKWFGGEVGLDSSCAGSTGWNSALQLGVLRAVLEGGTRCDMKYGVDPSGLSNLRVSV